MHMADALVSPAVGGAMWAATAAATVYCAKRVREESDPAKVPLMGVTGAFIFAAQMVNFSIPGTGSSGHLGGGLILALLLGPGGSGALLRRRGPARSGREHLQPRLLPGVRGAALRLPQDRG
jgi:ABC-type Co2+ transport system permease subunit